MAARHIPLGEAVLVAISRELLQIALAHRQYVKEGRRRGLLVAVAAPYELALVLLARDMPQPHLHTAIRPREAGGDAATQAPKHLHEQLRHLAWARRMWEVEDHQRSGTTCRRHRSASITTPARPTSKEASQ